MDNEGRRSYESPKLESLGAVLRKTRAGTAPNSDAGEFEDPPDDAFGPGEGPGTS